MNSILNPTTLLLVDDDPSMVRLLKKLIERSCGDQLQMETLTDSAAALERIDRGGIDILVSDLDMPGIDGLDLLRCAKQRSACTQVLFLTGQSTQQAIMEAMELGATDYLLKPAGHEELLELIRQAQGRQRRWQQALAATWKQRRITAAN
jgi:two-component system response regulator YesN